VLLLSHPLPYPQSFQGEWGWLWRDHAMKQLSGYTLLLLAALLGAIGLRKRIARWQWGGYGLWRAAHAALGLLALAGTVLHSGGRVGQGIAGALSLSWMLALLAGAALALLSARAHVLPGLVQRGGREALHAVHVAALWGLPVLLGFHIAGAYLWH
ncbi:MAG: putative NAD(FAD)-dependent dehydrogenase, partial [Pseudomonadota bacterium]|jgi:nitrite reductase (NADH) large subunit